MKVLYDGPPASHPATGLDLVPGEMEVDDDKGAQLLAAGLVRPAEAAPKRARRTEKEE